jgi:tetratricopeptide (TPR) repeat protein/DNA-binding XRE family transcriptional regulator
VLLHLHKVAVMADPEQVQQARRMLGRKLASLRRAAGLSQQALADGIGFHFTRSTVANVEVGRQNAPIDFWVACDAALQSGSSLRDAYRELLTLRAEQLRQHAGRISIPSVLHASPGAGRRQRDWGLSSSSREVVCTTLGSTRDDGIRDEAAGLGCYPTNGAVGHDTGPPIGGVADERLNRLPGDRLTMPCRMADGKVVFVSVPRRTLLVGSVGALVMGASSCEAASSRQQAGWTSVASDSDLSPVESFRQLRSLLVDQDNLVGPAHVLPAVRGQVQIIHQLRCGSAGHDRKSLLQIQSEYAEFAGWLSQDLGDFRGAQAWLSQALEWAHAARDHDLVTYILARKSQLAGDVGDATAALDMAEAAQHSATPRSRLRAAAATYGAYGHALAGDADASARAIDDAFGVLEDAEHAEGWARAPWLDRTYIEVQAGRCLAQLGRPKQAVGAFQRALDILPAQYRRDRGVYLARQAWAYASAGEIEQAANLGGQALNIAATTRSHRIEAELVRIDNELNRWPRCPQVDGFRDTLNGMVLHEA